MKSADIDRLLPGVFQQTLEDEHGPLRALLSVMEDLHEPVEQLLGAVDAVFDPYRTPDSFVAYLAGWLDLTYLLVQGQQGSNAYALPSGIANLRELVNAGSDLIRWRGTSRGLVQFLETATGATGFRIEDAVLDEEGMVRPFHIRIDLPPEAEKYRPLIDTIVRAERPAHVTYELGPPPTASTPPGGDASLPR